MTNRQVTDTIMMIRPASFGFNPETAESNAFQVNEQDQPADVIKEIAIREFDAMVEKLKGAGIEVIVVDDDNRVIKTDAVFPNNWISLHEDGTLVTYPMLSAIRRHERRADIISLLQENFVINRHLHLEDSEERGIFLEGTGSLILDRQNRLAYACVSPRTDKDLLEDFCRKLRYKPIVFRALDPNGLEIYHTNVMMNIGETFAVVCLESIRDLQEKEFVVRSLETSGKEVVEINFQQMLNFAGNMLQVVNSSGERILVMSEAAYRSLGPEQLETLEKHSKVLTVSIPTIEKYGGGSARCMMAEVFCQKKNKG